MKIPTTMLATLVAATALDDGNPDKAMPMSSHMHRYLIERTFPAGALDRLDAATKQRVNANNASVGVRWIRSFATPDKTRTFCIYEAPSEAAVREAAKLNQLPVDRVVEVPETLLPK
jgi:hypothetical protein